MEDSVRFETTARDVYDMADPGKLQVDFFIRIDGHGSLIVDDAPEIEGGTFNVIMENRLGVPHLVIWTEKEFGNDPAWTINLRTGDAE